MTRNYKDRLCEAITYRKQTKLPKVSLIITFSIIFTLAFIAFAIVYPPANKPPDYNFASEHGSITALSGILLAMASAFCMGTLLVNIRGKDPHIGLFVIMSFGMAFLALDELMQFHERIGSTIGKELSSGIFRNWNDVIVILYGIIAMPVLVVFLPRILRYRMLLELLAIAFLFYAIHTLIDSTHEPRTTISVILEESAKLFSGLFLLLSAYIAFLGSVWNYKSPDSS